MPTCILKSQTSLFFATAVSSPPSEGRIETSWVLAGRSVAYWYNVIGNDWSGILLECEEEYLGVDLSVEDELHCERNFPTTDAPVHPVLSSSLKVASDELSPQVGCACWIRCVRIHPEEWKGVCGPRCWVASGVGGCGRVCWHRRLS